MGLRRTEHFVGVDPTGDDPSSMHRLPYLPGIVMAIKCCTFG